MTELKIKLPAAIFDVDGTLADVSGVRHYVADPLHKDFTKFHGAASYVPAHAPIVALAQTLHASGIAIFVVTGRMEHWRFKTSAWLQKWEVPMAELYMRPSDDQRKDVEVKREILARIRKDYTVVLAVDDNPNIIALWNEESIPCVTWAKATPSGKIELQVDGSLPASDWFEQMIGKNVAITFEAADE